jgi:hypothetical protein
MMGMGDRGGAGQEVPQSLEFLDAGKMDGDSASASAGLADVDHGPERRFQIPFQRGDLLGF